jgi:fatty-acid peroxygenase
MPFAAAALHDHPEHRGRIAADLKHVVHEVRRLAPFFPGVGGVALHCFDWRGTRFHEGDRFVLDLYGTDMDGRLWDEPERFRPERFAGRQGDAYTLIPQGGGDFFENHRCAGEWLTIAVMKAMLRTLVADIPYEFPPQDVSVDRERMPALPESGVKVRAVQRVH